MRVLLISLLAAISYAQTVETVRHFNCTMATRNQRLPFLKSSCDRKSSFITLTMHRKIDDCISNNEPDLLYYIPKDVCVEINPDLSFQFRPTSKRFPPPGKYKLSCDTNTFTASSCDTIESNSMIAGLMALNGAVEKTSPGCNNVNVDNESLGQIYRCTDGRVELIDYADINCTNVIYGSIFHRQCYKAEELNPLNVPGILDVVSLTCTDKAVIVMICDDKEPDWLEMELSIVDVDKRSVPLDTCNAGEKMVCSKDQSQILFQTYTDENCTSLESEDVSYTLNRKCGSKPPYSTDNMWFATETSDCSTYQTEHRCAPIDSDGRVYSWQNISCDDNGRNCMNGTAEDQNAVAITLKEIRKLPAPKVNYPNLRDELQKNSGKSDDKFKFSVWMISLIVVGGIFLLFGCMTIYRRCFSKSNPQLTRTYSALN